MTTALYSPINDAAAAAAPGERVNINTPQFPCMATATHDYEQGRDVLWRRYAWCQYYCWSPNEMTAEGMWFVVRDHWTRIGTKTVKAASA